MNAKKLVEKNKILEILTGSHLYGTATKDSDKDYIGIFMPDEDLVLGFEQMNEVDMSIKSKTDDGRNDKNAIDRKFYEFRKFIKLAMDNNPNVLELFFVNNKNIIFNNKFGQKLLENRYLFPHAGLKQKYLGYAFSQKHKMIIRTDNFHELALAHEYFTEKIITVEDGKKLLVEILSKRLPFLHVKGDNINIGDLNFQKHFMLRKVKKILAERLSKVTNRKRLLTKYGFDTKFAGHAVRLMLEGIELLTTGEIQFPLKECQLILDIKLGKYKMTDVLEMSEHFEHEIETLVENTHLPKKPRYKEIQKLTKKMLKEFLFNV